MARRSKGVSGFILWRFMVSHGGVLGWYGEAPSSSQECHEVGWFRVEAIPNAGSFTGNGLACGSGC